MTIDTQNSADRTSTISPPSEWLSPHFRVDEFTCKCGREECDALRWPRQALIVRLESLRERAGRPLVITSGLRCDYWNRFVGGKGTEHITGEAADLLVRDTREAYELMEGCLRSPALFARLGYGRGQSGSLIFHVGVSGELPTPRLWTY